MAKTRARLMQWTDKRLMGERSLKIQVDLIVMINIICTLFITIFFVLDINSTLVGHVSELKKIKDTFIISFSCFASIMMVLAWNSSENLSKKFVKDGNFERPELDLIWASWAIAAWQLGYVLALLMKPYKPYIDTIFSSLNNMFFLWAASDFVINRNWIWHRNPVFQFFQDREKIFYVTIGVILFSIPMTWIFKDAIPKQSIQWALIPDLGYSFICVIILSLGFICVFYERYLNEIKLGIGKHSWLNRLKRTFLYLIICSPFLFTILKMFILTFPPLKNQFFELIHAKEDNAETLIDLYYKSTLILLFLSLEISWVRLQVTKRDTALKAKDRMLSDKEKYLDVLNKDLNSKKLKLRESENMILKKLRENRNLKNEISHRFKNHLEALSLEFDRQIKRYTNHSNGEITPILTSIRSRIEATKLVHEHLDNKKVELVNFAGYLKELCEKLKSLFFFPEGQFIYHIDEKSLNREISFGDARGIGIAITEIIINIDQHAYSDPAKKYLFIQVAMAENLNITIEDQGEGFKHKDEKKETTKGKGIPFVKSIIENQLFGSVRMTDRTKNSGIPPQRGVLTEIIIPARNLSLNKTNGHD